MTVRCAKVCKCNLFFDSFPNQSVVTENVADYLSNIGITPVFYIENEGKVDATTSYDKLPKKTKKDSKNIKSSMKGNVPLELVPKKMVILRTGQIMKVPGQLHQLCNFVLRKCDVKKIFKKAGKEVKQEEIKSILNKGENIPPDTNTVDVAQVIFQFLKELPVSVIPECQHKFFLNCYDHADREDVLTLACLLLPPNHVNVLTYLMQFFEQVSTHHKKNKMNLTVLGQCIGPVLMPVNAPEDIKKTAEIMTILMKRADLIGMVPEMMTEEPRGKKKKSWVHSILGRT